ncbi:TIGR02302 family protein [Lutimaribacter pacificus]|uniref:TIGR02302 family protein n=1 Tax=Lutimaribacter pacificus TaxID=391948 RepID=A0A1H0I3B3_9RHOB|nr:TIGR02302 family protein [Lutimaribacter pacificus]SDO25947.1 TIGR02302 family protein [Lutimaribacter pacificus]SHK27154.1 TIGR02302 family protein [Lutimaribacter pacificus]
MTDTEPQADWTKLRRSLALTWAGLWAERITQAFWPVWTVLFLCLAGLMLGLHDSAPVEAVWAAIVAAGAAVLWFSWRGLRAFRIPRRMEALARMDARLPGRPIGALLDKPAIGADDPASVALWRAHQARAAAVARNARAVEPDLRVSRKDPFALRYVAVLALAVAILFGSILRVGTVTQMTPGGGQALATGPAWEGWIEPPAYTGLPTLYMADIRADRIEVPQDARVILRFYGKVGDLTLDETVSGRTGEVPPASAPEQDFTVAQSGNLAVSGPGGRSWQIAMRPDGAPSVEITGEAETSVDGQMTLPFTARDDYGVVGGTARIELDLAAVDRRHGLTADPEPRPAIEMPVPLPITGTRAEFEERLVDNFSQHPWARLPVRLTVTVEDAAGLTGQAQPKVLNLPARRFFDPMASAIIEQRRDLLWTRDNGRRVAQILRTLSHRPEEGVFKRETDYLRLRGIIRRLEANLIHGLSVEKQDEIAQALWDLAVELEDGDLDDALERLRQAQERLQQAMKNGASDEEIARLMQELRDATRDYMRQLAQQAQRENEQAQQNGDQMPNEGMTMTQDDLQRMMDRIQELMEQGRMAEAQQALEELQRMLENMQVTQGQGQGQQSPGQQAMEGLAETLRNQQGLSDQAFRDLQEQFNPGQQQGQQPGQQGQQGQQGQGQQQGQKQGQGQQGQQGQGQQPGQQQGQPGQGQGEGQGLDQSLADRQRALRQELDRQRGQLPGVGGEAGEAAREALDRAGRAMDGAEDALRDDDLPEAIDRQAEAMDALRDGIRNLGEAMAEEQRQQQGGENTQMSDAQGAQRDPLGRNPGSRGQSLDTGDDMLQGEDVYRRARELLDEIRRRSGDADRTEDERDYLRRLLERF